MTQKQVNQGIYSTHWQKRTDMEVISASDRKSVYTSWRTSSEVWKSEQDQAELFMPSLCMRPSVAFFSTYNASPKHLGIRLPEIPASYQEGRTLLWLPLEFPSCLVSETIARDGCSGFPCLQTIRLRQAGWGIRSFVWSPIPNWNQSFTCLFISNLRWLLLEETMCWFLVSPRASSRHATGQEPKRHLLSRELIVEQGMWRAQSEVRESTAWLLADSFSHSGPAQGLHHIFNRAGGVPTNYSTKKTFYPLIFLINWPNPFGSSLQSNVRRCNSHLHRSWVCLVC